MNALEIIQQASITLGFPKPSTISNQTDSNTQRLLGCLNRALENIIREYNWQAGKLVTTFQAHPRAEGSAERSGVSDPRVCDPRVGDIVPEPIRGYLIDTCDTGTTGFIGFATNYIYNLTQKKCITPITIDEYLESMSLGSMTQESLTLGSMTHPPRFTMYQNKICFFPQPNPLDKLMFYYRSTSLVLRSIRVNDQNDHGVYNPGVSDLDTESPITRGSITQGSLTPKTHRADYFEFNSDTSLLSSQLLLRGLIWQYKYSVGDDYAESYRDYQRYLEHCKSQDAMNRNLYGQLGQATHGVVDPWVVDPWVIVSNKLKELEIHGTNKR